MHQQKYFLKLNKEAFIKNAFAQYLRYAATSAIPSSIRETSWQKSEPEYLSDLIRRLPAILAQVMVAAAMRNLICMGHFLQT
jgi:hypothetical protein